MWSDEVWSGGEVCSGTMVRCVVVVGSGGVVVVRCVGVVCSGEV